ncbi:hypothetical protein LUZ63_000179 [Rhynchospora breviuscula]|uniref:F-box domain-containing protein n=1 Tax=Rhynchospora breviuscula TaxID=2022672 RepID=A0A9Q0CV19_9POAL|nr:hypothetical protein LUZ63_000179 [Rhynchospora breviuscula]
MKELRNHSSSKGLEVDWISSLPDEVLTHILLFLTTKEAVQTCILSKRWRNTWAALPTLDFNINEFWIDDLDGEHTDDDGERRNSMARFEQFVYGVLDNREPKSLDLVRYSRQIRSDEPFPHMEWLNRIALLMPRVIHICINRINFSWVNSLDLPDLVFSSARLQHLKLGLYTTEKTIIKPALVNLPSLKVLELSGVQLHHDFTQKLFMGCPSLEILNLCTCDLHFSDISSKMLKKLTIVGCRQYEQVRIACPGVVSLFICSHLRKRSIGISLKNMISLVNASVGLYRNRYSSNSGDMLVLNILSGLSNATHLELYMNTPELKEQLEKDIPNCRNFNNLKTLCIGKWNMSYDFYLVACLLKHSPNLKELLLSLDENQGDTNEDPRQEAMGAILCQHEYLETVKIYDQSMFKFPRELIDALIKTLNIHVRKIGNIIIS